MNAPKIPSLFKLPRHKYFEYKPIYYDETKERIKERREQLKKEGLINDDKKLGLIKYRINQRFQRNLHQKEVRQANSRIIFLIIIILLVLYYIFK
jgi:hypothetical protein